MEGMGHWWYDQINASWNNITWFKSLTFQIDLIHWLGLEFLEIKKIKPLGTAVGLSERLYRYSALAVRKKYLRILD